jgi:hypothetical protein
LTCGSLKIGLQDLNCKEVKRENPSKRLLFEGFYKEELGLVVFRFIPLHLYHIYWWRAAVSQ